MAVITKHNISGPMPVPCARDRRYVCRSATYKTTIADPAVEYYDDDDAVFFLDPDAYEDEPGRDGDGWCRRDNDIRGPLNTCTTASIAGIAPEMAKVAWKAPPKPSALMSTPMARRVWNSSISMVAPVTVPMVRVAMPRDPATPRFLGGIAPVTISK